MLILPIFLSFMIITSFISLRLFTLSALVITHFYRPWLSAVYFSKGRIIQKNILTMAIFACPLIFASLFLIINLNFMK